jgi:hypothetical protein
MRLRSSWIGIMWRAALRPLLDSDLWFQDPGAVTFRTFGGLREFCLGKLESASATTCGFNRRPVMLLGRRLFEVEVALEEIQVTGRQQLFVLKTADNDARGDAEFGSEAFDALRAETPILTESS